MADHAQILATAKLAAKFEHDALEDLPRKVQTVLKLIDKLYLNKEFKQALVLIDKQIQDLPEDSDGYLALTAMLGVALIQLGEDIPKGYKMVRVVTWMH
jgi:hypothetical protein